MKPFVFLAIDTTELPTAIALARQTERHVFGVKLGLEFFNSQGHAGIKQVAEGRHLFLDLKLHDIPNTVAGAVRAVASLRPYCLTVHASGGSGMMRAARDAAHEEAAKLGCDPMRILGVTVLTSLDDADLDTIGQQGPVSDQVRRLAELSLRSGLDGVIASAHEVRGLRERCGSEMMIVVPGIRPRFASLGDQKRVMSPAEAMRAGASHLVIGRPITEHDDPATAARMIAKEMAA